MQVQEKEKTIGGVFLGVGQKVKRRLTRRKAPLAHMESLHGGQGLMN